jgi:hypothetical protein
LEVALGEFPSPPFPQIGSRMNKVAIFGSIVLLASAGCAGSPSISSLPASGGGHPASMGRHLSTATKVVPVSKSAESGLRLPKNSLGGIPLLQIVVNLFDAPLAGSDAHVNLALVGINAISNGVSTPIMASASPVMVDLLTLQSTAQTYLANVPAGTYDTVQLVVDPTQSNVVQNGATYPVQFGSLSSGSGSYVGIDAPAAFSGAANSSVAVTVDFNVLESVAINGGIAQIDPQLVTSTDAADVAGSVQNAAGQPVSGAAVLALDANGNVLNSAITAADGSFDIHALGAGSATIVVENSYVSASGATLQATGADGSAPAARPVAITGGAHINIGTLTD